MKMCQINLFVLGILVCSTGAFAQSDNPMKMMSEKIQAEAAKERLYLQTMDAKIRAFQDQILPLQKQWNATVDAQTRQNINTQLKPLLKQRDELLEEMAEHAVEIFQARLDKAKERLAKIQQRIQSE